MVQNENVVGKALDLVSGVLNEHAQASRQNRAVPFGRERDRRQVRSDFDNLTPEKLAMLIQEHGRPAVNNWIGREMKLRERRQKIGG
jgi:hypothetical protein